MYFKNKSARCSSLASTGCVTYFPLQETKVVPTGHSDHIRRTSPLSAVKRLINPPSVMLRVKNNWVLCVWVTELVNLSRVSRADGEPVQIGIWTDVLALVEVADHTVTKDITAEADSNLLVEVDVFAVFMHALDAGDAGVLGCIALCRVGAIGGPGEHWQRDGLGDLLKQKAVWHGDCC